MRKPRNVAKSFILRDGKTLKTTHEAELRYTPRKKIENRFSATLNAVEREQQ
jgi:hypothetical protein